MNTKFRYQLDSPKVTGRQQQKSTCPQCGRKHCFVRYVDTQKGFSYLNDDVGRCDHEQSCGYHYKPSEFFHDHPWLKELETQTTSYCKPYQPPRTIPLFHPLAPEHVWMQHSTQSTFWQWMVTGCKARLTMSDEVLQRVYEDYMIGATRQSDVIFWQIDEEQRVHTGHIMQYGPDGHRLGFNSWEHRRLMREGRLPKDFVAFQCLFGQHLLRKYPAMQVCIVESEKTAVILSACYPDYLWMATCGSGGLTADKLASLKGRRLTLFPDSGCYDKWLGKMKSLKGIDYAISDQMEQYLPNTDLADVLLGEAKKR